MSSPILTLRDLDTWSSPGTALAVLGQPIGHSISPAMHNAALAELARQDRRFSDWKYHRFEVSPGELPRALAQLHAAGFRGINLTVPHKVLAFDQVAEVADAARPVGAVNTLLWSRRGWIGHNTDGYGLATALAELGHAIAGAHVVLLGAGGAARGAAVECLQQGCASLTIVNRGAENLAAILSAIAGVNPRIFRRGCSTSALPNDLPANAIVINATSAGLRGADAAPIELQSLPRPATVFDMIYNPPRTRLMREAEALGVPTSNGLSMLVHQGAKALEIWSGIPATQTAMIMRAAASEALAGH